MITSASRPRSPFRPARRGSGTLALCLATLASGACGTSSRPESEPPPAPLAIDPACASPLANVPGERATSPGVTADPRPREEVLAAAESWDLPEGVTFELLAPAPPRDGRLTLRGELVNGTAAPQTVMLSEAGAGFFGATLVGPDLVRRTPGAPEPGVTPPPALFPEPHAFTLAPGARWPLETTIVVSCWEPIRAPSATAHWWLHVEGEGIDGEVQVATR